MADTNSGSNQGGFTDDGSNITGFSSLHDSGTGGSPSLGNFPLFPYSSCLDDDVDRCNFLKTQRTVGFQSDSLVAEPGYFGLTLDRGVGVDMTTTQHTSLFRFNFTSGSDDSPLILLDLTDLSNSRQDNATISVDTTTSRMTGSSRFLPSFGSGNYTAYFCADFSGAEVRDNGIFVNSRANSTVKTLQVSRGINGFPLPAGAWTRFAPGSTSALARVGLSFISSDQACSSAEAEIPSFDFNTVYNAASAAWDAKLAPISIELGDVEPSYATNFYSGIYRTMQNPQNYTGENPLFDSSVYFDSFYCLWDSFRSQLPFLAILDPNAVTQMVSALLSIYQYQGWLPDCHMSFCKGVSGL